MRHRLKTCWLLLKKTSVAGRWYHDITESNRLMSVYADMFDRGGNLTCVSSTYRIVQTDHHTEKVKTNHGPHDSYRSP